MKRKKSGTLKRWQPLERADGVRVPGDLLGGVDTSGDWFLNNFYQVQITSTPGGGQLLSIKPRDGSALHDWRHFQWIKNELCGDEREAIELYPAESRLVDTSNQFWLYVLPLGMRVPYGWDVRCVSETILWSTSTQRPFPEEKRPADLRSAETARSLLKEYLSGGGERTDPEPLMPVRGAAAPPWPVWEHGGRVYVLDEEDRTLMRQREDDTWVPVYDPDERQDILIDRLIALQEGGAR